jgi:hypothetical protein
MEQDMNEIRPEWASVLKRILSEAESTLANNVSDGIAIVTIHVAVDGRGAPLVWVVPEGKRIEPSKYAKSMLIEILSGS